MGAHVRLARSDPRGQSESTGVILIVLVAFILESLVAAFAFTTFDEGSTVAPSVAFSYEYGETGSDELRILVESESSKGDGEGNGFDGANVEFVCDSGSCSGADGKPWGGGSGPDGQVVAGDSHTLSSVGADAVVLIRWEEPRKGGDTVILGVWRGPES